MNIIISDASVCIHSHESVLMPNDSLLGKWEIGVKCNINEKGSILKHISAIKIHCAAAKGVVGGVDKITKIIHFLT